jgi:L-fuconolactonase
MAMRLDSHQHFWIYNDQDYGWMGDQSVLKQDYLPAHSEPCLRDNGFHGTIAVQARQTPGETDFLIDLKSDNDFIMAVVGWTDLMADSVLIALSNYQGKVVGFRHQIEDESEIDFMLQPKFKRGLRMLGDYQYTFDLLVRTQHLENCLRIADEFPDQPFVIDHLGKPEYSSAGFDAWHSNFTELAKRQNVYCKLSGMVTETRYQDWDEEELEIDAFLPFLDCALEAFSADRLMFGSDWPVCSLAATFDEVCDITNAFIQRLSTPEQEAIMGNTAASFYHVKEP